MRLLLLYGSALLVNAIQPSAPPARPGKIRPLPWGQLNFLHTTDSHGWHAGHLQESQYSADWGDYISFAHHLRNKAEEDGVDLLLVDTGDRVEGNGLYDASSPKGKYSFDIIKQQPIDIITSGNHELYLKESVDNEIHKTVPNYEENYIASNLDILDPKTGERKALAQRFKRFTTPKQKIRILAFGFLFDFHEYASNSFVIPVEKVIKMEWFRDAIREKDVDLIVVAGHVAIRDSIECNAIFQAIRSVQPFVPILFVGGHSHIRDYVIYDERAVGIESGRYMETIGFQSISGLNTSTSQNITNRTAFDRRYIDNNLYSMYAHSHKSHDSFETVLGRNVTEMITFARKELNLDQAFGCAPHDLWSHRAAYPSNDSILSWMADDVLPFIGKNVSDASDQNDGQADPAIVLTNTGAIRFDIFAGPFTIDTTFLISPFTSPMRRLRKIPYTKANKILNILNHSGPVLAEYITSLFSTNPGLFNNSEWSKIDVSRALATLSAKSPQRIDATSKQGRNFYQDTLHDSLTVNDNQSPMLLAESDSSEQSTPGFTTRDDLSDVSPGDDTVHSHIPHYRVPNVIAGSTSIDEADPPLYVDVIYNGFMEKWILLALRFQDEERQGPGEVLAHGQPMTKFMVGWIIENWPCKNDRTT